VPLGAPWKTDAADSSSSGNKPERGQETMAKKAAKGGKKKTAKKK
jgi:hypothetical protein